MEDDGQMIQMGEEAVWEFTFDGGITAVATVANTTSDVFYLSPGFVEAMAKMAVMDMKEQGTDYKWWNGSEVVYPFEVTFSIHITGLG